MGTPLLITGDLAVFPTTFGAAVISPMTAPIVGTGKASVDGKAVCVAGDEASVVVASCPYTAGAYSVPGTAMLTIESLVTDQSSQGVRSGAKAALLARSKFVAKLQVLVGAQLPPATPPPPPDSTPSYTGEGEFQGSNARVGAKQ